MKRWYNEITGIYKYRHYAKKDAKEDEVVVKVDDGYKIIKASDYNVWKKQNASKSKRKKSKAKEQ